jgi:hypothetical protein
MHKICGIFKGVNCGWVYTTRMNLKSMYIERSGAQIIFTG